MLTSARRGISYPNPDRSDPADVPAHISNIISALELDVVYGRGVLTSRPVSTPGSPGMDGRFYYANDSGDSTGDLHYDYGTGWRKVPMYQTDGSLRPTGHVYPATDNAYDLGIPGTNRWRNIYTSGKHMFNPLSAAGIAFQSAVGTESARFQVDWDGKHSWGPGGVAAVDTTLSRIAANNLITGGTFQVTNALYVDVAGTGNKLYFGVSADTNLYRGGAGQLYSDGRLYANMGQAVTSQVWVGQSLGGVAGAITLGGDAYFVRNNVNLIGTGALLVNNQFLMAAGAALNVNTGAITVTASYHDLTTTGGLILTTINNALSAGHVLILCNKTGSTISVQPSSNIHTIGSVNVNLLNGECMFLYYDNTGGVYRQIK
jgi:hypothetical protein